MPKNKLNIEQNLSITVKKVNNEEEKEDNDNESKDSNINSC